MPGRRGAAIARTRALVRALALLFALAGCSGGLAAVTGGGTGPGGGGGGGSGGGATAAADMVAVPAGPFMMGCNERVDRACDADERPYHAVSLGAFAVDRTEVTQAAWARCLRAGACTAPTANFDPRALPDYPVTNVGWEQARAYCAWAGKRLPTEAEWEKAARGPDGRIYPWGDALPDCAFATLDICGFVTEPVGTHRRGASPYGAYDLAGNVVEWVADLYDAAYYAHSPPHDPRGPELAAFGAGPTDHVRRGGDLAIRAATVRASNRTGVYPAPAYFNLGFRCAAARAR